MAETEPTLNNNPAERPEPAAAVGVDLAGLGGKNTAQSLVKRQSSPTEAHPDLHATILAQGLSENLDGDAQAAAALLNDANILRDWAEETPIVIDCPLDLQGLPDPADALWIWQLRLRPIDRLFSAMAPLADMIGAVVARARATLRHGNLMGALGHTIFESYPAALLQRKDLPSPKSWSTMIDANGAITDIRSTSDRNAEQMRTLHNNVTILCGGLRLRAEADLVRITDHELDAVICGVVALTPHPADLDGELEQRFPGRRFVPPCGYLMDGEDIWWSHIELCTQHAGAGHVGGGQPAGVPHAPGEHQLLCPAGCGKLFQRWPWGADSHAKSLRQGTICNGIPHGLLDPDARWEWYREHFMHG